MYARVISFTGADPSRRDEAEQTIRGEVLPALERLDGFTGYIGLMREESGIAKAITLWDSRESAEAAEEQMSQRRKEITSRLGLTVQSVDLYEAPIVELRAGARV